MLLLTEFVRQAPVKPLRRVGARSSQPNSGSPRASLTPIVRKTVCPPSAACPPAEKRLGGGDGPSLAEPTPSGVGPGRRNRRKF